MKKVKLDERTFTLVDKIIVHGGDLSHQDEQVACALAWAAGAKWVDIERREPSAEELQNKDVLVLDVGGQHAPELNNFDHHGRGKDEEPKCAYCLLAEYLGLREFLGQVFPWFEPGIVRDVRGPVYTAKSLDADWQKIQGMVETPAFLLHNKRWAKDPEYRKSYSEELGLQIWAAVNGWATYERDTHISFINDIRVLDTRLIPSSLRFMSSAYAKYVRADVLVGNDDRGPGLSLVRQTPCDIDFSRISGNPAISFVYNGFLAKTATKIPEVEYLQLINAAMA